MSSYAQPSDLWVHGAPQTALGSLPTEDVQAALDAASTLADGYLRNKFTLPILTASQDLVMAVCQVAAWNLIRRRGFNPEDPGAESLRLGYQDAVRWLERVAAGTTTPSVVDSSPGSSATAAPNAGGPFVVQPQATGDTDSDGFPTMTIGTPRSRGWVR